MYVCSCGGQHFILCPYVVGASLPVKLIPVCGGTVHIPILYVFRVPFRDFMTHWHTILSDSRGHWLLYHWALQVRAGPLYGLGDPSLWN